MLGSLANLVYRRPWRTLMLAVVFVTVAGVFGGPVAGLLSHSGSNFEDPDSESVRARERIELASGVSPEVAVVVLVEPGADVRSGAGREKLDAVENTLESDPGVGRAVGLADTGDPAFVSRDGRRSYLAVSFRPLSDDQREDAVGRIKERFANDPAVRLGGSEIAGEQIGEQVAMDLARAETIAFPLLFLVSLFVFRGVVAALLPLLCGLVSILTTLLALRLVNEATPLSIFALNLVTGLGLGLAIDYSLFIVSRYREELARVGPGAEALRRTLSSAGRTVAFSALTVAVALAGLLVFPLPFLYSMGLGGMIVALASAATALIVLPAVLALLGARVNALSFGRWRRASERIAAQERTGFWYRLSQAVMRRPIPVAAVSAAVMIALGLPFLRAEFTGVDAGLLPESASAHQVHDTLAREFPPARSAPITVAIAAPTSARGEVETLARRIRALPDVAAVSPAQPAGDTWALDVVSTGTALSAESKDLVREIRALDGPDEVLVSGETAGFLDQQASLQGHLPFGLAILVLGTLGLLFLMTGSLVIPVKTLLMNLLTVSAAFGILVLVFQDGRLERPLDFTSQGALESTQPILLFAVAFALSTDYAVFLLGRIKEARDSGLENAEAVAVGLERTGRIVTAAALLFSIALGAFSTSEIVFIKLIGVGAVAAVLLDATIVRALLVPSLMKLLGEWNWWAPEPLRRLYLRVALREA
jgi:uncharacterized membrane protein YdfJ with MMPL/SSD domain